MTFALAAASLTGCDHGQDAVSTGKSQPSAQPSERRAGVSGKDLMAYAPATDFSGAAPEDASRSASAMFDGSRVNDAVADPRFVAGGSLAAGRGKRELLVPTEDNVSEPRNRRVEINVR